MSEPASAKPLPARNPGPSWGYRFLRACDLVLPEVVFKPLRALGTWIALAGMPAQRRHSRTYLALVLDRKPTLVDVFRHFFAFEESLMLKLRVANGRPHCTVMYPGSEHFRTYLNEGHCAFLGTFHIGRSDLMGFLLGPRENHRVFMVRHRVANSHDTEKLGALFDQWLKFIWVNEPENLLFALKEAVAAGGSIAMKCDRLEFSSKTEAFEFFGARRLFPFTIYHLAMIFRMPVLLSVGMPGKPGESVLHGIPRWEANPALGRAENLAAARAHFQSFLFYVEKLLRAHPYLWFNFMELNPVVQESSVAQKSSSPPSGVAASH